MFKKGDVVLLKTRSGDEYVGEFVDSTDETVTLDRPFGMFPSQTQEGVMLQLMPLLFAAPGQRQVTIYKDALLIQPVEAPESVANHYRKQVSGIEIVTGEAANSIIQV